MLVIRGVRRVQDDEERFVENPPVDLSVFRSKGAWVLLAEPGAGKSTTLSMEAEATTGQYLRIDEFLSVELEPEWKGKTLFLDGLDEIRAGGTNDSIVQRIKAKLKRLGNPAFRIACRAADWYGSTDTEDLKVASPDGEITRLVLEPLSRDDILAILRENHDITDPTAFIEEAEKRGVAELLTNPQALKLLAESVQDGQWPKTRDDTYRLACEKLAQEADKRRRDRTRKQARPVAEVLDAAGQLCAVLLLSDRAGIALDPSRSDKRFPALSDCSPPDVETAIQAVGSKLFRPEGEERVVPSHRSIAEYLAARWMAQRIDNEGLPLRRVTSLLLGSDGGVVAGLRGLFAWLALHCQAARSRLIERDPVTVVVYGDITPMSLADKREILKGLRREAERFTGFVWDIPVVHPFGALSDPDLQGDFLSILQSRERDNANQSFVRCVLEILDHGQPQAALAPALLSIVRDDTYWLSVRKSALDVWLHTTRDPSTALALLNDVSLDRIADSDDELAGTLLRHLYPKHINPDALLRHLHLPKNPNLFGVYVWFWEHALPERAPDEHLLILLDALTDRTEFGSSDRYMRLRRMVDMLLARGVVTHGDHITDERLFAWLGIGFDEHGHVDREKEAQQRIADWLRGRPERYKSLLALCFQRCEDHKHQNYCIDVHAARLHGAPLPDDIGLWHLEQASVTTNEALARLHLSEAVSSLFLGRGASGLSLERLEAWGASNPKRKEWLGPLLFWEIPEWRTERAIRHKEREKERLASKRARTIGITRHLFSIRSGTAPVGIMHELAGVWGNLFIDIRGETVSERFDNYSENGIEVQAAAEEGFRLCLNRSDLPTVNEIIELSVKQREHLIRLPCLIGMELLWKESPGEIESLGDETVRRMIAFRLTYGADETPKWFRHFVEKKPALVAEVLVAYASAALKVGKDFIDGIYPLAHDLAYRDVAVVAAPRLLEGFPVRARTGQLRYLESLIKATLRYAPGMLNRLVGKKIVMKGMDVAQKVYWHATAMLLDPIRNEPALWRYVGKSEARANQLAAFLSDRDDRLQEEFGLSAKTIGKLIELIAPHAETEWRQGGGRVTDAMRRGDQVRGLITRLGTMPTAEAANEIDRLLGSATLSKLKLALESARHQQRLRQRESEFRFLPSKGVAQVLANEAPASSGDLLALALDLLDDIAQEIRRDNDDGFRAFWNVKNNKPVGQRDENLCRDALLTRLRARLVPLGIDCQPEGDYVNDKRADIRLSYRNEFEVPIEIKRDSNPSLWDAPSGQLDAQYAIAPRAGYGIYLVLWFGGHGQPRVPDGGKRPRSAAELQARLIAMLAPIDRQRIFVRVLDVTWLADKEIQQFSASHAN